MWLARPVARWTICILILLFIAVRVFHSQWSGKTSFPYDFPMAYYAMTGYWISSLQSGEFPQWIPYEAMGYPASMNPQLGIFYPPFWIFVLFRISYTLHAASIFQILHVVLGSTGILALASRLFKSLSVALCGAVAFIFFGGFYTNAEHPDIIRGFAWIPWLMWAGILGSQTHNFAFRGRLYQSKLELSNLMLPIFVMFFITGAYPGQIISGLLLLTVFLVAQAGQLIAHARDWRIGTDPALQLCLLALGVTMAAAFLLPSFYLTREITRAHGYGVMVEYYLGRNGLLNLIFPSNFLTTSDYSMNGMQMPVVLLLFIVLVNREHLKKLAPFVVIATLALFMCLEQFRHYSEPVKKFVPMLALSRFPAGDYREFIYLAVLVLTLAGLERASLGRIPRWRQISLLLLVTSIFSLTCLAYLASPPVPGDVQPFLKIAIRTLLLALGTTALALLASRLHQPKYLPLILPLLICVGMVPVVSQMSPFWKVKYFPDDFYKERGLSLSHNGRLRALDIFQKRLLERPERRATPNLLDLSWRGYIDGSFMSEDLGGTKSIGRSVVEASPDLTQFMAKGSTILAFPCNSGAAVCGPQPHNISVINGLQAGTSIIYSRNFVKYGVTVSAPSLIVENEIYTDGWAAICESHNRKVHVERVDGALRGWILPTGAHKVRVYYQTPLLWQGTVLSMIASLCWLIAMEEFLRRRIKESVPATPPTTENTYVFSGHNGF